MKSTFLELRITIPEFANKILDAEPKVITLASCGVEPNYIVDYKSMLDSALEIVGLSEMKNYSTERVSEVQFQNLA